MATHIIERGIGVGIHDVVLDVGDPVVCFHELIWGPPRPIHRTSIGVHASSQQLDTIAHHFGHLDQPVPHDGLFDARTWEQLLLAKAENRFVDVPQGSLVVVVDLVEQLLCDTEVRAQLCNEVADPCLGDRPPIAIGVVPTGRISANFCHLGLGSGGRDATILGADLIWIVLEMLNHRLQGGLLRHRESPGLRLGRLDNIGLLCASPPQQATTTTKQGSFLAHDASRMSGKLQATARPKQAQLSKHS
mmetsp:Transcript_110497/g.277720  ORF Transcript_110497/g.277720 Transcript_110497/m.277720 type:complete len:247 (-) Transcript_110497:8-748(-)